MPETKGQNFQDVQESALQVTGLPVRSTNEQILSALDQDKNQPLRLHESTTPDSLLNITASKFQMFNGVEKNVTPVNNVIPNFVATTINFQTQVVTGGTVNITWPASTVGQYRLLCFTLLSSGEIDATFSDEETTIGALPNPGSLFLSGGLPIGWITLECTNVLGYFKTAGSTTNIIENKVGSDSRIFLFGSGGSSGAGIGEVDFLSLKLISDYNAYDDGAVSTPVDGSGGSATVVSVSEETSNPIDTTESVLNLKVSKTAANGQGEGISVDFTTRGEIDYASPQFITVEVKSSANYVDDDFGIYVYDKDNSTLITPADPDVKASTLVSKQVFEFQTASDADDYRLIFHCKTTNANAYDLTFTVKVGPTPIEANKFVDFASTAAYEAVYGSPTNGSAFFNTTSNFINYYNGSSWVALDTSTPLTTIVSKTTTYTATTGDEMINCDSSGGAFTITLYAASGNSGRKLIFHKTSSDFNAITIDGNGAETINGNTTTTINTQYEKLTLLCDGTNWIIENRDADTAWTSYTPGLVNFSQGAGATLEAYWSRQGDSINISFFIVFGTGLSVTGAMAVQLPTGLSSDSSKQTTRGASASVELLDADTSANREIGITRVAGSNISLITSALAAASVGVPFGWAVNDAIDFQVNNIPISGWKGSDE